MLERPSMRATVTATAAAVGPAGAPDPPRIMSAGGGVP